MANLYIGTSGYSYQNWRESFYPPKLPQKDWLTFYAQHYNAVEINATFYRPFPASVYSHWHEITPDDFRFVLKAPKIITHQKALHEADADIKQFTSSAQSLHEKLGGILWQFPASTDATKLQDQFPDFLAALPKDIKHIFEFRNKSWFQEATYSLLNQIQAGFVNNDSPHFPKNETITDSMVYVRFHGPGKLYDSLYTAEQLNQWADKIRPYLGRYTIYLFFNNTFAGQGLSNAKTIRELLAN